MLSFKNAFPPKLPSKIHRQLLHQHHLQSHVHFGNDPTVTNHTGILSTTHAPKTGETPCIMRNRSDHDPPMIRTWSAHDATTHETVSQPSHRKGRSSRFGKNFLWKNIRFCRSAISQKRISCETFFKFNRKLLHEHHLRYHLHCGNDPADTKHNGIPSATHPPAPLAIAFTLREVSYSYRSQLKTHL